MSTKFGQFRWKWTNASRSPGHPCKEKVRKQDWSSISRTQFSGMPEHRGHLWHEDEAGVCGAWEWKEIGEVGKGDEVVCFARRERGEDKRRQGADECWHRWWLVVQYEASSALLFEWRWWGEWDESFHGILEQLEEWRGNGSLTVICVAWGWTWKCTKHETRIKQLGKNPKTPNTHSLTHTHTLSQSQYKSSGPLILKNITCVLKSLNSIVLNVFNHES